MGDIGNPHVARWRRFEIEPTVENYYANPIQNLDLKANFRSPSGIEPTVGGFWDGVLHWRYVHGRWRPDGDLD